MMNLFVIWSSVIEMELFLFLFGSDVIDFYCRIGELDVCFREGIWDIGII